MSAQRKSLLHFGPFTVDLAGHSLLREGAQVYVQEQPYRLLLALLEAPGQVVTRESLRLRLWGEETFVDFDQSLNSAVRRLRVALGDSPRQPMYVATVPRVGFRFLAEVRTEGWEAPEQEEVAGDGDEVVAARAQLLGVSAGSFAWARRPWLAAFAALMLIGGALAGTAGARVWGSVGEKRAGSGGSNRASAPSLRELKDDRQEQTSDAGRLVPVLETAARSGRPDPLGTARLTELTGWYHLNLRTEVDYGLAKQAFTRAIAADSTAPTPLIGLAEAEILMALNGYTPAERLRAAREAGERAVRLAPDLPDAHAVVGAVDALDRWDLGAAEREFHVALALDPHANLPRLWLAVFVLLPQHRYSEAEQQTREVIRDAPLSLTAHTNLGWIFFHEGRREAAEQQFRFVLTINPEFVPARFHYMQLLRAEGREDEARRMRPNDPAGSEELGRGKGDVAAIDAGATRLAMAGTPAVRCQQVTSQYAGGGTDAMSVIRAAVRDRCSNFFFFGQDPVFNQLHGNPEFAALQQTAFLSRR